MASIDTLLAKITDQQVRTMLTAEISEMRKRLEWGLVFERHLPEKTLLLAGPIKAGSVVWERRTRQPRRFRVRAIEGDILSVVEEAEQTTAPADAEIVRIARADVLLEVTFAEQVFPLLAPIDAVRNGPASKPTHAVIQGENFHVLQALATTHGRAATSLMQTPWPAATCGHGRPTLRSRATCVVTSSSRSCSLVVIGSQMRCQGIKQQPRERPGRSANNCGRDHDGVEASIGIKSNSVACAPRPVGNASVATTDLPTVLMLIRFAQQTTTGSGLGPIRPQQVVIQSRVVEASG